ncbi:MULTISPECIES: ABC transporter permease [Desulfovibrio]|uniref:Transport permease protein n=2 Tax=Desulfovibrio TaxID=872 RepID=A0AA94HRX5_DESDE|nr:MULTISPECIES: ABC transporter permease [Desulfovibrio]SFW36446.1 ABC-2 type transport system permease protein [Desulfovibrio desulfuricans]SPD34157.1 ABC transporter [Desulfovibrio sp. G11]
MFAGFSFHRFFALLTKELIQMRRDKATFSMLLSVPLMEILLFGYAINADPKHLPTLVVDADQSVMSRSLVGTLEVSGYFDITNRHATEDEARSALANGAAQFVVNIPVDFSRRVARGECPQVLIEADATDPSATSAAIGALSGLAARAIDEDLRGPLAELKQGSAPYELLVHRRYNEENESAFSVVPGILGVVLSSTMIMMTSIAMTRERERGTLESLLVAPIRPLEMMLGKISPYLLIGFGQILVIMTAAKVLFHVPMLGSMLLLFMVCVVFICANLALGFIFSSIAKNQMQANQASSGFLLPSIILSGFMFPYRGMPEWAQWLGEILPVTHFLRIVRGILLKGNTLGDVWGDFWALVLILGVVCALSIRCYRRTLD